MYTNQRIEHQTIDNKENPETKVESKEEQPVVSANNSTSGKDDTETKENTES